VERQYFEAMIGLLRGRLLEKRPNQVILDVGGVGYLVAVPLSTFATLGELHGEVTLLIHTHVREDALALYGFLSAREKHLFELLLGASGVGPTLALKILSGMNVEELVPAIRTGDLARLTKIPGVGRKTAERMVVELKDKLEAVTAEAEKPASDQLGVRRTGRRGGGEGSEECGGHRKLREITASVVERREYPPEAVMDSLMAAEQEDRLFDSGAEGTMPNRSVFTRISAVPPTIVAKACGRKRNAGGNSGGAGLLSLRRDG
jgi:Holliday junction DNA helicase RuvA